MGCGGSTSRESSRSIRKLLARARSIAWRVALMSQPVHSVALGPHLAQAIVRGRICPLGARLVPWGSLLDPPDHQLANPRLPTAQKPIPDGQRENRSGQTSALPFRETVQHGLRWSRQPAGRRSGCIRLPNNPRDEVDDSSDHSGIGVHWSTIAE